MIVHHEPTSGPTIKPYLVCFASSRNGSNLKTTFLTGLRDITFSCLVIAPQYPPKPILPEKGMDILIN